MDEVSSVRVVASTCSQCYRRWSEDGCGVIDGSSGFSAVVCTIVAASVGVSPAVDLSTGVIVV